MKRVFGFICILCYFCSMQAQIVMKGKVQSSEGEALPFINVAAFSATDTTHLITGSITDIQGNYILPAIKAGQYHLVVSAIGYCTVTENMRLRMPTVGNVITKDFITCESTTTLQEVTITASRKSTYADKSVYTFSKNQIKSARYSSDLLTSISDLSKDLTTDKITKLDGGSVKILINGVNATNNDLKSIPPEKVLKVEYYDIPPARYATIGALVNIITKRLDTGWNGGLETSHAFTTGFGNDNAYLKYVSGNHQFSLDYEMHYRNYKNRHIIEEYQYQLDEEKMDYLYHSKDKFGYTTHNINLKYTYDKPDNYTLQIVASPNYETRFSKENSDIQLLINEELKNGKGNSHNSISTFGPSADIYFSKKLKNNQELVFDIVGTYFHNKQEKTNRESDVSKKEITLDDQMKLRSNNTSLIGEIAYTKTWGVHSLNFGYKTTLASSSSTISNYISGNQAYDYKSSNNNQYLYAEYGGIWKKIMYRLGIGGTHVKTNNDDTQYSKFLFTPKLVFAYQPTNKHTLQWVVSSQPSIPTISQLSNNAELLTNGVLRRGNPYLKSGNNYISTIRYNWNTSRLDLSIAGFIHYAEDPINTYYQKETVNGSNYIVATVENATSFLQYGGFYSLSIRPFKNDIFNIKLYGLILKQKLNSPIIGKFNHWYTPLFYSLNFRKGAWGAIYNGNIVSKQLDGAYINQDENQSNLQVFYQHRNFRFIAGCYWFLTKSKYYNETLPNNLLRHSNQRTINDNRSMFTLGFSWNFSTGKSLNIKRKIENKDTDKGTF